jgi:hypothetical protein
MKRFGNIRRARGNARETEMGETLRRLPEFAPQVKALFTVVVGLLFANVAFAENRYAGRTDHELTTLAADWETLSEEERRALLTEMRGRMAQVKNDERPAQVIAIRTQRRYGRLVRQPDGSLVRVETTEQIVRYERVADGRAGDRPFGVGFERRTEPSVTAPAPSASTPTPVLVDHAPR